MTGRLSRLFDTATRASELKPRVRKQLIAEQISTLAKMIPALAIVMTILACILLTAMHGHYDYNMAVVWSFAQFAALAYGLAGNDLGDASESRLGATEAMVSRQVVFSFALGVLWAIVPFLFLPLEQGSLGFVTVLASMGAMCTACFVFASFPPATATFLLPALLGAMLAGFGVEDYRLSLLFAAALMSFAGLIVFVSLRQTRLLVEHLQTESTIRDQRNIIGLLLKEFEENSSDWLWEFDSLGAIDRVSDRFALAAGGREQIQGRSFMGFLQENADKESPILAEIEHSIANRATFTNLIVRLVHGNTEKWWRLTGKPAFDDIGAYTGYIGTASDVTAEKLAERRINFLAHNDALTGLLNRARFTDQLGSAVARLERYGSPFAVLYLDLDQFKAVNDGRGHLAGDKLLAMVAKRLKAAVRETDFAARLGGDEFAAILTSNCRRDEIAPIADRLVRDISAPYEIDGELVTIGVSIGIAVAPLDGTRPDQILRNADLALYRAKASGRGVYRFFESQMDSEMRERRMLEMELRHAIDEGELVLHYQPLVSAESKQPSGFEALVRWNHPLRGVIPPAEFIPIAEQTGIIQQIGDWTLRRACADAASWPSPYLVAVNLSARHFQGSDIVAVVRDALMESGLAPSRLELEITESLLIDNPEEVVAKLNELKKLGVTIAMDDFGTGYSSLAYLMKFPFDKIKIDKSFVNALSEDAAARDILRSIASLGRTLRMKVTAEGVETPEQVEFLREISLSHLQGYFFARPLDSAGMAAYLLNNTYAFLTEGEPEEEVRPAPKMRAIA